MSVHSSIEANILEHLPTGAGFFFVVFESPDKDSGAVETDLLSNIPRHLTPKALRSIATMIENEKPQEEK